MTTTTDTRFATEARAIDDEREAIFRDLKAANARGVTGADIDAVMARFDRLDRLTDLLRREFYPKAARLTIALGMATTSSPARRKVTVVWRRESDDAE